MVAILILLTAFFVAAEFAIVKIRLTRIDYLISIGNKRASDARKLLENLDGFLSACQLGITVTALGLGWLGEPTVVRLLQPLFDDFGVTPAVSSILSFAIAFMSITFLHVVIGELAPKMIAIQKAEAVALLLASPLNWFYKILYPFIWLLNGSARQIVRLLGFKSTDDHDVAHTEEELRVILSESYESGEINQVEMTYVNNIFEFDERLAKEIMVPRTEMVCLFLGDSYETHIDVVREGQFTRYRVADGDKDHIIGLVNIKRIFTGSMEQKQKSIEPFIRPIIYVSEGTPINQALLKMQKERIHMAIVLDEYGGTAGLVTVEDILEEIVGEIRDEFDVNEEPMIERIDEETLVVDGKLLLTEVNDLITAELVDDDVDTIGGWFITHNLEAEEGTTVDYGSYQFIVEEIDGYQIKKIKIVNNKEDIEESIDE